MFKKLTAILLAMLLTASLCITASAAELSISSDSKTVSKGDSITMTISLSGCANANTLGISINFNANQLSLESGKWLVKGLLSDFDENTNKGVLAVDDENFSFNGNVFELTFKVKDDSFDVSSVSAELIVRNDSETVANVNALSSVSGTGTHTHKYDQKIETSDYLKSAASCTENAVYYYSCTCGEKGSKTFTSDSLGHTMQYVPDVLADCLNDGMLDYYYCTVCQKSFYDFAGTREINDLSDLVTEPNGNHTFSNGVCIVCGAIEDTDIPPFDDDDDIPAVNDDDEVPAVDDDDHVTAVDDEEDDVVESVCDHEYDDEWLSNSSYHWQKCIECEETGETSRHNASSSGSNGEEVRCTVCDYLIKEAKPAETEPEVTEPEVTTTTEPSEETSSETTTEPAEEETSATTTTPDETEPDVTTTQPTTSEENVTSDTSSDPAPESGETSNEEENLPADTEAPAGNNSITIILIAVIAVIFVAGGVIGFIFYKKKFR